MPEVLLTVEGPGGRHDLRLPADVPLARLLPTLIGTCGGADAPGDADGWSIVRPDGADLDPRRSLSTQGVLDGAVLALHAPPPAATEPAPPADRTAPPPPGGESLSQRSRALLPPRLSWRQRVARSLAAGDGGVDAATPPRASADAAGAAYPSPEMLVGEERLSRRQRARTRWRESDYMNQLTAAIHRPQLGRCVTIAVVSPKGGVGKTTVTVMLGTLLSLVRRDRVVAVDTNPDFGSLGRVLSPEHRFFVDDLLATVSGAGDEMGATELGALLARAAHGLQVLPAPTDPERMKRLDEAAYRAVIRRLQNYAGVILLDCGTGLQEPAALAALGTADQVLLVSDAQPATASLVAEAGLRLAEKAPPITLVVNKLRRGATALDLESLGAYLPQAAAAVTLADEPRTASALSAGRFTWQEAPGSWQVGGRELAATVVAQWPALGLVVGG